jgi:hypothetical protein
MIRRSTSTSSIKVIPSYFHNFSVHRFQFLLLFTNLACCGGIVGVNRLLPKLAQQFQTNGTMT